MRSKDEVKADNETVDKAILKAIEEGNTTAMGILGAVHIACQRTLHRLCSKRSPDYRVIDRRLQTPCASGA